MSMSTAETTVPLITTTELIGFPKYTDLDTTVNVNPAQSGSGGGCSTVGIVVGCVVLVLLATVIIITIVVLI